MFISFQERHWHAIFLGMNEPYNAEHQFTVAELMSYNLSDHSDLVHATYMSAIAEYDLEQRLLKITKFWQDRQFKLAKHIPDSMFTKGKFSFRLMFIFIMFVTYLEFTKINKIVPYNLS